MRFLFDDDSFSFEMLRTAGLRCMAGLTWAMCSSRQSHVQKGVNTGQYQTSQLTAQLSRDLCRSLLSVAG